jgi:uncharacterized protein (TIGR03437 family)
MVRRTVQLLISACQLALWCAGACSLRAEILMTGTPVSAFAPLEAVIATLMTKSQIPGGVVAVANQGRLVYARGFGYSDQESRALVQPDSLFRFASVSKVITSVAILHLVEEGRLRLDDKFLDLLGVLPTGADQRLRDVTVRMLLQYAGGWDPTVSGYPEFRAGQIASVMNVLSPPDANSVAQYLLRLPLDFTPGTKAAYGNTSYLYRGRLLEKVTGQGYETYVRAQILAPMGIRSFRIARTLRSGRLPDEVTYYDVPGASAVRSVYPGMGDVSYPYGGQAFEHMDSFGGWLGSAIDLVRFSSVLQGRGRAPFLSAATRQSMLARPTFAQNAATWWGLGPMVQTFGNSWYKTGSTAGIWSMIFSFGNGIDYAVLFNAVPPQEDLLNLHAAMSQIAVPTSGIPFDQLISRDHGISPRLPPAGVTNGASFRAAAAPGSIVTLFGTNLSASTASAAVVPLPLSLASVSVVINDRALPLFSVSPTQINAQLPVEIPSGPATIVVMNGTSSIPVSVSIAPTAPGIFTYGNNRAVVQNADGTLNGPNNPAAAGSTAVLYTTGQGTLDHFIPSGAPATVNPLAKPIASVTATVGDRNAAVQFAGMTPGAIGLMQVNFVVPHLPAATYPITITIGSAASNAPEITLQ